MSYKYDLAVFIGRFQPFHIGHKEVIDKALEHAERVLVLVGSSYAPRNYRNPFSYDERSDMILDAYKNDYETLYRVQTYPIEDVTYNDNAWVENIQNAVYYYCNVEDIDNPKITLVGHEKDNSSFYLKLFPQWDNISVENVDNISSTDIRYDFFFKKILNHKIVPENVKDYLYDFAKSKDYDNIVEEYQFVEQYKKSWENAPYEPIFVTVDACVVQSGHVLLVQRKARPGKGLWALPGGFLNNKEKIIDGVIRELKEETKIKVPVPVLKGNIVTTKVFDDPYRSSRGRTITHGFLIHLPPDTKLPQVKGSDDAKVAKWWPLADVRREMLFEDHKDIIDHLTAML